MLDTRGLEKGISVSVCMCECEYMRVNVCIHGHICLLLMRRGR